MPFNADTRMGQEYVACGLPFTGFTDGVPQFSPALSGAQTTLKALIDAAHIVTDGVCGQSGWLNTDLNSGTANVALKTALGTTLWNVYAGLQKAAIDEFRRTACHADNGACDAFFCACMEAVSFATADLTAAQATYATVKAQYPYPTSY